MRPHATASAIQRIRRAFDSSGINTNLLLPNTKNTNNVNHKDKPLSWEPGFDFGSISGADDARHLFRQMLVMEPLPPVVEFTKLLNAIVKMKRYNLALSMFHGLCRRSLPVDERAMSVVINCYCLVNRVGFGFAVVGRLFKLGYEPDVVTFTILIKGLFMDGKVSEAEELFKKLLTRKICEPNDVMFGTVVNGLCKAGRSRTACDLLGIFEKDLFGEMGVAHRVSSTVVTFSMLVDGFCKEGKVKEAEDVLEIMMRRNVCPNIVTYNSLIDGYCLQGQMDKARKVFDSIPERGLHHCIISYVSLINGYCKKGNLDEAWRLFLDVPSKGLEHTTVAYNAMIHGLFHAGRFTDGWNLFLDMEAQRIVPNLHTYCIMIDGLCKNRRIAKAFSFLRIMEEKGFTPHIMPYNAIISGLCKDGKLDIARNLFDQLPSKGLQPSVHTYTIILVHFVNKDMWRRQKICFYKWKEVVVHLIT